MILEGGKQQPWLMNIRHARHRDAIAAARTGNATNNAHGGGGVACSAAHLSDPGSYFASLSRPRWCAVGTVKNIRPPLPPHTDYCQHPCHPKLNKSVPRKSNGHHAHARLSARGEISSHWAKSGLLVFLFSDDTAAVYQQCMAKRKSAILIFDPQDYICSSSRQR